MQIPAPPQWLMILIATAFLLAFAIQHGRGEDRPPIYCWSLCHGERLALTCTPICGEYIDV